MVVREHLEIREAAGLRERPALADLLDLQAVVVPREVLERLGIVVPAVAPERPATAVLPARLEPQERVALAERLVRRGLPARLEKVDLPEVVGLLEAAGVVEAVVRLGQQVLAGLQVQQELRELQERPAAAARQVLRARLVLPGRLVAAEVPVPQATVGRLVAAGVLAAVALPEQQARLCGTLD